MSALRTLAIALLAAVTGCATTVRQSDLDAWSGVSVEALDTHSFFLTVPMFKTVSSSGIEIRNYTNGKEVANCMSSGTARSSGSRVSQTQFTTCSTGAVGCNNLFYIKDGRVIEYAPTGRCFTDESVRPQQRYLRLQG